MSLVTNYNSYSVSKPALSLLPAKGKHDALFEHMLKDLSTFSEGSDALSEFQYAMAEKSISQYRKIDADHDNLMRLTSGKEKEDRINRLIGAGAEEGFGKITPVLVDLVTAAYEFVKNDREKLHGLFSCFSMGGSDACLTVRTERLCEYFGSLLTGSDLSIDQDQALEAPAYILSTIMYDDYFDDFEAITADDMRRYLLGGVGRGRHLDRFVQQLKALAEHDIEGERKIEAFKTYLSVRGIYTQKDVNWRDLALRFIDSSAFVTAHALALVYKV